MNNNDYEQNLTKLVKGGSISTAGNFISVFSSTLSNIFIPHLVGSAAAFGLYDFAFRLTFFIQVLVVPGVDQGLKRYIPIYRAEKNHAAIKGILLYSLKITALLSVLVVVALLILAPAIAGLFNKPESVAYIRILAISIPFFAFLLIAVASLTAIHQVKYQVILERMLVPVIRLLIFFTFMFVASSTWRILAVVWSFPISLAIACFIALYFFFKIFHLLTDRQVKPEYHGKELIKFSLPLAANRPLLYLMNFLGTFIIAYFLTDGDIGQYGIVTRLAILILVPLQSANLVFLPFISELHHTGKLDELERHFKFISKWIFTFSLFIFIAFILMPEPLLTIFGQTYNNTKTQHMLIIIGLAQLFSAAVGPVGALLSMTGRPRIAMYNTLIMLTVNLSLCLVLVPLKSSVGGIVGAGICLAISILGVNTLFVLQVRHYLRMHPFSIGYLKPLVAGIVSFAIVLGIIHLTGFNRTFTELSPEGLAGYLWVVIYIFIFASILGVLYALFIYLLGLDETDKFVLRKMFLKLKRRGPEKANNG